MGDKDIVVWFSCGAASASALKLTVEKYGIERVRAVYNPVIEEHPDNLRFLKDVSAWVGIEIELAENYAFPSNSAEDVWKKRRYMAGNKGAPCTGELKKNARRQWEDLNQWDGHHVMGFTQEELSRHIRRVQEGGMRLLPVLIDAGMSKQDCFDMLHQAGIRLPEIYSIGSRFGSGFPNANCIGCVKATTATYWNHVRETFPEVFAGRATLSRELGARLVRCHPKYLDWCVKRDGEWWDMRKGECLHVTRKGKRKLESPRIFLDELPPDARGRSMKTMRGMECGITCGIDD